MLLNWNLLIQLQDSSFFPRRRRSTGEHQRLNNYVTRPRRGGIRELPGSRVMLSAALDGQFQLSGDNNKQRMSLMLDDPLVTRGGAGSDAVRARRK